VRGKLHHRRHEDIIKEIREAVDSGISLITLLGQNVNSYQDGDVDFIKLIHLVNSTKGLKEVTFITSHPRDTTPDLFRAMADLEKVKKDLHLPVQSGSDKILKLMNRGYSRKYYLDLAKNYRKIVNGGFTTDIIVGFPGESEEDFKETYSLLKEVKFNAAYIFKYSPRPHTQAVNLADDVIKEEKERRHKIILELQRGISKRNAKKRN
jgi:tRNA-2-methylthio-N6-dimethylallyladenosine synthase